ncbi:exocyst complex component 4-like [Stegodyphus dumicola]|uniref:exocyst complex component 4-like n=1 Tax=Stegodyphus dumicola TaxID=202533 RepID=UPI0015AECC11|nr:exocyst complex component 4-like [Stegodyphus dumicola]XP_035211299.1 exocyst complex component 4-like [Stegodyphus dumicola]
MAYERLPALIAELSYSKSDGDRHRTRARVQERFDVCNARLDQLVKENREIISKVVETSSKTIQLVAVAKFKCRSLKERILACKEKLQCKQDDLRKLWLESLQHQCAHKMLEQIDNLRNVLRDINNDLHDKKFLQATDVLASSLKLMESEDFRNTDGLKDIKSELYRLQEKMYSVILDELRQELYASAFDGAFRKFQEQMNVTNGEIDCHESPVNAFTRCVSEENFGLAHVATLLHCITVLKKLPETAEFLKERCGEEFLNIIKKASIFSYDYIKKSSDIPVLDLPSEQQYSYMVGLLEVILDIFRQILLNHKMLLCVMKESDAFEGFYQIDDIYSQIQTAVEHFIGRYLELQPSTTSLRRNTSFLSNSENVCDWSSFFLPKKHYENKQPVLFSFSNSSPELGLDTQKIQGGNETNRSENDSRKMTMVCKPALRNIVFIFRPLKSFITEIEKSLQLEPGIYCPLHVFLSDCASLFLDQVSSEVNRVFGSLSNTMEAWKVVVINENFTSKAGTEKQILSSTLILSNSLKELQDLITYLPDYANHFLHLMHYIILDYKELVHKAFKSLIGEDQTILSASWARDPDIRRLLKSFSNWKYMQGGDSNDIIESPEEIRLRNKEESELLIRNLHSEELSSWEIISDPNKLTYLSLLQESLEWFTPKIFNLIKGFELEDSVAVTSEESKDIDVETISLIMMGLKKLAKEYDDLADVCLLTLHLEVRAHCFYYLLAFSGRDPATDYSLNQELVNSVQNLSSDLLKIDETLMPFLSTNKLKYIFEGVGELLASIVILNIANLSKISDNLFQKIHRAIFILQCCLGNIILTRELSLERAKQYIDLLNFSYNEILNQIVEEGPRFREHEYASIFRLISSKGGDTSPNMLNDNLLKLAQIFKRISVTI